MPDALLEAEGVSVRYDRSEAWVGAGLDLRVAAGEVVLLLGPSGCGKSTLALTLNGLIPHSAPAQMRGSVHVAGKDTAHTPPGVLCADVGMVFQDPDAQIVCPTLLDEVCFGLENLLVPLEEVEPRAMAALAAVGLATAPEHARRDPARLSGGQRQKLALACALAMRPWMLVLDEPTANLDPASTRDFYQTVAGVAAEGTSVVLIEHDLDDAVALANRVVVLDAGGAVRLRGSPAEVFAGRAAELAELGVYGPTAVEAARRLGMHRLRQDDTPLTMDGLAAALSDSDASAIERAESSTPFAEGPSVSAAERVRSASAQGGAAEGPSVSAAERVRSASAQGGAASGPRLRVREPAAAPSADADSGDPPLVEVDDLVLRLGGADVLRGVSLSAARGDYLAVAGVNGAGKSTLVGCLAGVLRPPPGSVRVGGADVARLSARELSDRVGFVFQNPEHQFVANSVAEELAHGLRVRARPEEETTERVAEMLERFGLTRYQDVNPFLLSHGEKRRLSVGTALICGPELLVLDEPTFGQDRARAGELLALLDQLHSAGTTVVVVSHDLQLMAEHATHVAVMASGRLLAHGSAGRVLCDDALLERAGLRPPPVRRLAAALAPAHPEWRPVYRLSDLDSEPR